MRRLRIPIISMFNGVQKVKRCGKFYYKCMVYDVSREFVFFI